MRLWLDSYVLAIKVHLCCRVQNSSLGGDTALAQYHCLPIDSTSAIPSHISGPVSCPVFPSLLMHHHNVSTQLQYPDLSVE